MLISQRANELFILDGGQLVRRIGVNNRRAGTVAGFVRHGIQNIRVDGKRYYVDDVIELLKENTDYATSNGA